MTARAIAFTVDGEPYAAAEGQTLAAALLAAGRAELRTSPSGAPRGLYCGIGICHECRVEVVGRGVVRSCLTPAADGMEILTSLG